MNTKITIDKLYKHSATEKTPKDIDNIILSQAKAHCDKNFNQRRIIRRSWLYGLSTAAVFVMGLSMIINLQTFNDQAQVPKNLEDSIYQYELNKPVAPAKSKKNDSKKVLETKVESQSVDSQSLVNSPMPQAKRMKTESKPDFFPITEPIQESDDKLKLYNSDNLSSSKNETISKNQQNFEDPNQAEFNKRTSQKIRKSSLKEKINHEKKPSLDKDQTANVNPVITSYDYNSGSVIVRNEEEFTATQIKIVKVVELNKKLKKFTSLIKHNKKDEATELLNQLRQDYPGYDFREYIKVLQNLKPR